MGLCVGDMSLMVFSLVSLGLILWFGFRCACCTLLAEAGSKVSAEQLVLFFTKDGDFGPQSVKPLDQGFLACPLG